MKPSKTATIESVASYGNLLIAHANARRGKSFYNSVLEFEKNQTELLHTLQIALLEGTYKTSEYRHEVIKDSLKFREISKLPYYPDRIVHWAIMLQLERTLMDQFSPHTHAAIAGRGIHSALYQTKDFLEDEEGTKYCLKFDIAKYFPHVNHQIMKEQVRTVTKEPRLLDRLDEIIDSVPEEKGLPIGNYLSQYLANKYLTDFDKWLELLLLELTGHAYFVRYMDDVIILAGDKETLWKIKREIEWYISRNLYLELKSNWQIFPVDSRSVDYVGYKIYHNQVTPRKRTFIKIRKTCLKLIKDLRNGATFTDSNRSSVMSLLGGVLHCTKHVRLSIFNRFFKPIFDLTGIRLKKLKMRRAFYVNY